MLQPFKVDNIDIIDIIFLYSTCRREHYLGLIFNKRFTNFKIKRSDLPVFNNSTPFL